MTPEQIAKLPYRLNVGVCLTNLHGQVWVGERLDRPDAWQMPQGGIDEGEAIRDAGYRELEEETGLSARVVSFVAELAQPIPYDLPAEIIPTLWKGKYRGQMQHWLRMGYDGPDDAVDLDAHVREFARWQWMEPGDVLDAIVPFKRDAYIRVFEGFGLT